MRKLDQHQTEAISSKLDSEGFDYYMENYGSTDLEGTIAEPYFRDYQRCKREMVEVLGELGVEVES